MLCTGSRPDGIEPRWIDLIQIKRLDGRIVRDTTRCNFHQRKLIYIETNLYLFWEQWLVLCVRIRTRLRPDKIMVVIMVLYLLCSLKIQLLLFDCYFVLILWLLSKLYKIKIEIKTVGSRISLLSTCPTSTYRPDATMWHSISWLYH